MYGTCVEEKCVIESQYLLKAWCDIQITKSDYDWASGAKVKLESELPKEHADDTALTTGLLKACLLVTFTTADGKSFEVMDDSLYVS